MIVYGTQYYRPPFPQRTSWKSDLLKIKELNFNTVKLWAVWSWVERKKGEFFFEDLDEIIHICQETGLNVVINIIPEGAPYWLLRRYPEARYRTAEGFVVEAGGAANMPSGGSPGLCTDHEGVSRLTGKFIQKVVERYAQAATVVAFDVWNEPHIEPIFDFPEHLFCYCKASKRQFIKWLKDRYGNITALNQTWLRAYQGWEDISPPVRYGTYPDMIDWRLFWVENLGRWLEERVVAARKFANGRNIMTHVPFSGYIGGSGEGGLGYHLGDEFLLAPLVDIFGLTSFPKWLMGNDHVQHLVNLELVASSAADRDFWQCELQAGAGKWESAGRPVATPDEIRLWNWSAVACGAKGILYWQWKPEPSGMEAPGFGLTNLDGSFSPRTCQAMDCARAFNRPRHFDKARQVPPVNGIFISRTADLWWHAAYKGEPIYARSIYGVYRACFQAGIPVRMVHADHLKKNAPADLQVLYLPAAVSLSGQELENLGHFVETGGILVSEACPGLFDEHGVLRQDTSFLEQVLGLSSQEVDHCDSSSIEMQAGFTEELGPFQFLGRYYRQEFNTIHPGTTILGRFEDHRPAIFERSYGKGRAILVGTFPGVEAGSYGDENSQKFITRWMKPAGFAMVDWLKAGEGILFRLHQESSRIHVMAVNYSSQPQTMEVAFNFDFRLASDEQREMSSDRPRGLKFLIPPSDGIIITLERI